jgi:hypothetical protein
MRIWYAHYTCAPNLLRLIEQTRNSLRAGVAAQDEADARLGSCNHGLYCGNRDLDPVFLCHRLSKRGSAP